MNPNEQAARLDAVLETCLHALEEGQTVEQALQGYPELAVELRPRLEAAAWVRQKRQALAAAPFDPALGRRRLAENLRRKSGSWEEDFRRARLTYQFTQAAALVLLVLMLVQFNFSLARAAEVALPGDLLYPAKLAGEQVQIDLASDPLQKAALYVDFARERSSEMMDLFFDARYERLGDAAARLKTTVAAAQAILQAPGVAQTPQAAELAQELAGVVQVHQSAVQALTGSLPPDQRAEAADLLTP